MATDLRDINLSEARRRLSSMLREIEAEPEVGYQIRVRDKVVAELRSPAPKRGYGNAGEAMLRAARKAERLMRGAPRKKDSVTSENYKEYLYGKRSPLLGRKQSESLCRHFVLLCAPASTGCPSR